MKQKTRPVKVKKKGTPGSGIDYLTRNNNLLSFFYCLVSACELEIYI